jgi:adrenodoxin-NADP+ reductase
MFSDMPPQAAFTTKELREVTKLPGVALHIPPDALQPTEADRAEMAASRVKKRVHDILVAAAKAAPAQ